MKLQIPAVGQELELTERWAFRLFYERRNEKLLDKMGFIKQKTVFTSTNFVLGDVYGKKEGTAIAVSLPKGTLLAVDRIYIKRVTKDMNKDGEYNSLSFRVRSGPYKGARFWAKLSDVNTINCTLVGVT